MDVVLGIMRDVWTTVFGLPDSTLDMIFGGFNSIIDWFTTFSTNFSMLMDLFQLTFLA